MLDLKGSRNAPAYAKCELTYTEYKFDAHTYIKFMLIIVQIVFHKHQ